MRTPSRDSGLARHLLVMLAALTPTVIGCIGVLKNGWLATGDNAVISLRSWSEFTSRGPLVGQLTLIRGTFDLGPLQYWLIAIPTHIDPRYGPLVGACLFCLVATVVAVEAARSAFGEAGGVVVALVIVGSIAWMPALAFQTIWNPHFGYFWFMATIACCTAVMKGNRWWWIGAVICASISTQAHLMFSIAAIGLLAVALGVGVRDMRRPEGCKVGQGWVAGGLAGGIACWTAPFVEQLRSTKGNMVALLQSQGGSAREGLGFGLRAVAISVEPDKVLPIYSHPAIDFTTVQFASPWLGIFVCLLAIGLFALGLAWRSRALTVVAAVNLAMLTGLVLVFANIPQDRSQLPFYYLIELMFPAASSGLVTVVTAVHTSRLRLRASAGAHSAPEPGFVADRTESPAMAPAAVTGPEVAGPEVAGPEVAGPEVAGPTVRSRSRRWPPGRLIAAGLVLLATGWAIRQVAPAWWNADLAQAKPEVTGICQQIDQRVKPGPVRLDVTASNKDNMQLLTFAIAYCLMSSGFSPEVPPSLEDYLGPGYGYRVEAPLVSIHDAGGPITISVTPGSD